MEKEKEKDTKKKKEKKTEKEKEQQKEKKKENEKEKEEKQKKEKRKEKEKEKEMEKEKEKQKQKEKEKKKEKEKENEKEMKKVKEKKMMDLPEGGPEKQSEKEVEVVGSQDSKKTMNRITKNTMKGRQKKLLFEEHRKLYWFFSFCVLRITSFEKNENERLSWRKHAIFLFSRQRFFFHPRQFHHPFLQNEFHPFFVLISWEQRIDRFSPSFQNPLCLPTNPT
jgi:hypothetical protein